MAARLQALADQVVAASDATAVFLAAEIAATILGWKKGKVEQIAARYISAEAIGLALVQKLQRNKAQPQTANDAANYADTAHSAAG